jgi:hypothetical protein
MEDALVDSVLNDFFGLSPVGVGECEGDAEGQ